MLRSHVRQSSIGERVAGRTVARMRRIGVTALSVVVAMLVGSVVSSAAASSQSASSEFAPQVAHTTAASMAPTLPPVTIAACNAGLGETVISTYSSRELGSIDLKCGDSSNGYVHIRERHQNDWQQVVNIAGGGGNWDDLMEFITGQAIEAPSAGFPRDIGSGKSCFTTPAAIINSSGVVVRTLMPTVIVSRNNKKVITSIPTTGSPAC